MSQKVWLINEPSLLNGQEHRTKFEAVTLQMSEKFPQLHSKQQN